MNQISILIIDTDPTSRQFLAKMLQKQDFQVIEAGSAMEGLQKISENIPHVISCDANILDMRVYELIQFIVAPASFLGLGRCLGGLVGACGNRLDPSGCGGGIERGGVSRPRITWRPGRRNATLRWSRAGVTPVWKGERMSLDLTCLPRPQIAKAAKGRFHITREAPLLLSPSCDEADHFAATLFRRELEHRTSLTLAIEKHARVDGLGRPVILMRMADAGKGGFPSPGDADGGAGKIGDEGYIIEAGPDVLVLAANSSAGIYYGVQTLRQIIGMKPGRAGIDGMTLIDWPDFRYRGVLHDVTRGKVPTLDTLKGIIEYLGNLKMNVLQLYVEHVFAFRRHPDISRMTGALTAEDIFALDEHAHKHHVDLQPNLQSFGHMKRILSMPRYRELANSDARWTIAPGEAKTYAFLDDLYSEYLPCFSSGVLNANCDETWDLGEGRSRGRVEKQGVGAVWLGHVKKLRALAKRYGKRLAVWGDVPLGNPKIIKQIPRDVIMLNWGYGAKHRFSSSKAFADAKLEHWVCPGTNAWSSLFPRMETACRNIAGFAAAGKKSGATGFLNTDWGDGGHPNVLGLSFHGLAYGAEAAWSGPAKTSDDFDRRFSWIYTRRPTAMMGKIYRMLGATNEPFGALRSDSPAFDMYWATFPYGEALHGPRMPELNKCERIARAARAVMSQARTIMPEQRDLFSELDFTARQAILACQKARIARTIVKVLPRVEGEASAGFGGKALPPELVAEVADVHREWRLQRDEFERLWMRRARRSEIETRLRLYRDREQELARLAAPSARRPDML